MCVVKRKRVRGPVLGYKVCLGENENPECRIMYIYKGVPHEIATENYLLHGLVGLSWVTASPLWEPSDYYGFHAYAGKPSAIALSKRIYSNECVSTDIFKVELSGGVLEGIATDGEKTYVGKKMRVLAKLT